MSILLFKDNNKVNVCLPYDREACKNLKGFFVKSVDNTAGNCQMTFVKTLSEDSPRVKMSDIRREANILMNSFFSSFAARGVRK